MRTITIEPWRRGWQWAEPNPQRVTPNWTLADRPAQLRSDLFASLAGALDDAVMVAIGLPRAPLRFGFGEIGIAQRPYRPSEARP